LLQPRPLRPIKIQTEAPRLAWVAAPTYRTQLIQAAIERKGKKKA
jgi:hypothetical protein